MIVLSHVSYTTGAKLPVKEITAMAHAHDVLVVRETQDGSPAGKERLLPFVGKVIRQVDVAGGMIRVDWGADW